MAAGNCCPVWKKSCNGIKTVIGNRKPCGCDNDRCPHGFLWRGAGVMTKKRNIYKVLLFVLTAVTIGTGGFFLGRVAESK